MTVGFIAASSGVAAARLPLRLREPAAHGRKLVAVRIADVGGVEIRVVLEPKTRLALRLAAVGERRGMEGVDLARSLRDSRSGRAYGSPFPFRRGVSRERAASEDHRSDKARDPRRGDWRGEACRALHDVVSRSEIVEPLPAMSPHVLRQCWFCGRPSAMS
jgi:hypothetical protein